MNKWIIVGLGFISQKHIDAIKDIGDKIVAGCDIDVDKHEKLPQEAVFYDSFDELIDSKEFKESDWVAICTPNNFHYEQTKVCLDLGKKVICEKPLVINEDHFEELNEYKDIYPVLQLRHNPELQEVKSWLDKERPILNGKMKISLNRGDFYWRGWKGDERQSGGLLYNIGIHYFDLLLWFFGNPVEWKVDYLTDKKARGNFWFPNVNIDWELSLEAPMDNQVRKLIIGDRDIDLTRNFEGLHKEVYKNAKEGNSVPLKEVGRVIKLIEKIKKNG